MHSATGMQPYPHHDANILRCPALWLPNGSTESNPFSPELRLAGFGLGCDTCYAVFSDRGRAWTESVP